MTRPAAVAALAFLFPAPPGAAQEAGRAAFQETDHAAFLEKLDRDGRVVISGSLAVSLYDYDAEGGRVEAIAVCPEDGAPHPGILLVPGYSRTARDYLPFAVKLARGGFACLAATPPGFGGSSGPPDFAGPRTVRALAAGFERFRREACVDSTRMGVFGFSRGAMAASLLAVQRADVRAAVLGAGIYDLARVWRELEDPGIRDTIEREAGVSGEAFRERSAFWRAADFAGPVLILHGERDANAPVSQARLLADRLASLGKPHELVIYSGEGHELPAPEVFARAQEFFRRVLGGAGSGAKAARLPALAGEWVAKANDVTRRLVLRDDGRGSLDGEPIEAEWTADSLFVTRGATIRRFAYTHTGDRLLLEGPDLDAPLAFVPGGAGARTGAPARRLPENPEGRWRAETLEGPWDLLLLHDGSGRWNGDPIRWRYLGSSLVLTTEEDIDYSFQAALTSGTLTLSSILLDDAVTLEKVISR